MIRILVTKNKIQLRDMLRYQNYIFILKLIFILRLNVFHCKEKDKEIGKFYKIICVNKSKLSNWTNEISILLLEEIELL